MIDCKITENYLKEKARMCEGEDCNSCAVGEFCNPSCTADIAKSIEIVQKWSDTHPLKTYLSDFLEKYPKARLKTDGTPLDVCLKLLYDTDACTSNCKTCWNQPLAEGEK